MPKINIHHEMAILKSNFINLFDMNKNLERKIENRNFHPANWITTFPYNYTGEEVPDDKDLEIVRKLALINALYGYYFLREDSVMDDYHLPSDSLRSSILLLCDAHIFRNLAIGHLLRICGQEIFKYIYAYEEGYYQAVIFEKTVKELSAKNFFDKDHLQLLGQKLIPICSTFAAYCILKDEQSKISLCEEMVIKYHIAKQMLDDIEDLEEDVKRPDLSYLLKLFPPNVPLSNFPPSVIKKQLKQNKIDLEIVNCMIYFLNQSEQAAQVLNFKYFLAEIRNIREKALVYKRKSLVEQKNERAAV